MPANILSNNYSTENVFLGNKFFESATVTNSSGSTMTLVPGQVMGQILASAKWLPTVAAATDGSEIPRALCGDNYTIADGATATIQILRGGDVNENKVTFNASETWTTVVRTVSTGGGTIRSLLLANSDIKLHPSTELSNYDN